MSKERAIHELEQLASKIGKAECPINRIKDLVKEIEEPQPVEIPMFVADWLESKTENILTSLGFIWNDRMSEEETRISKWLDEGNNSELFVRAWLYGYFIKGKYKHYIQGEQGSTLTGCEISAGWKNIECEYGYQDGRTILFHNKEQAEGIASYLGDAFKVKVWNYPGVVI